MTDRTATGDRQPERDGVALGTTGLSAADGSVPESGDDPLVRQTDPTGTFAPPPARNSSQVGAGVFSNSGELTLLASDLELPGRGGVAPTFERRYRSSVSGQCGDFGHGFIWTYARRLVESDGKIVYDNGHGERYLFTRDESGTYTTDTLYIVLEPGDRWTLRRPGGRVERFEPPAAGGRLLAIEDRNRNAIAFDYGDDRITVSGPRGRESTVSYDDDRIVQIEDYAGRTIDYEYDADARLQTVTLPNGGTKEYEWTEQGRLAAVTAPGADEPYLENDYDDVGRVVEQRHGSGVVSIRYEQTDTNRDVPVYRTHVAQKRVAEPNLHLDHDSAGHVTRRVFDEPVETDRTDGEGTVRAMAEQDLSGSESDAGVARIETITEYNAYGEWVRREFPEGGTVERRYDVEATDPRDWGEPSRTSASPGSGPSHRPRWKGYYRPVRAVSTSNEPH